MTKKLQRINNLPQVSLSPALRNTNLNQSQMMTNTPSFLSTYISITYISVIVFRVTNIDVNLHKAKYPNQYNETLCKNR